MDKPVEYVVTDKMRAWGSANGFNVDLHIEFFNDYLANKTGKPYKDLDAAFRNCVRCDWGGIRKQQNVPWNLAKGKAPWWTSEAGIVAKGRECGLEARPGESMNDFKGRIERAV